MNNVAVLIPCYNEENTIRKVVKDYKKILPDAQVYVYDNNSTDRTAEYAEEAGAVVRHEYMQGKGNVVRRMFREVDADCFIITDGDDTYPADAAAEMAGLILEGKADMVIGDRLSSTYFEENKRPFHNTGNRAVRFLINKIFKTDVKDIMTGFRAFGKDFVKTFPVLSQGFEIETEMTIYAVERHLIIAEVPIAYRDRPEGSVSKLNTVSDGYKVLTTVFRLFKNYKPFAFFGIISLIFIICSMFCMVPVMKEYFLTGTVPRFPTLIVGVSFGICALLSFFSGVILDVIRGKHRQLMEVLSNLHAEVDRNGGKN